MMNNKFTQVTVVIITFLVIGGLVAGLALPFISSTGSGSKVVKQRSNQIQNVKPVKK